MIAHRINDSTEELKLEVLKSAAVFEQYSSKLAFIHNQ